MSRFAGRAGAPGPESGRSERLLVAGPRLGPASASSTRPAPADPGRGARQLVLRLAGLQRRPARGRAQLRDRLGHTTSTVNAMLGGRRLRRPAERDAVNDVQIATGAVMVVVALAMLARATTCPLRRTRSPATLPSFTRQAPDAKAGGQRRGAVGALVESAASSATGGGGREPRLAGPGWTGEVQLRPLRCSAVAPEFVGNERWFNGPPATGR